MTFDGLEETRKNVQERINDLYAYWLMEKYPEEVTCKDKLIDLIDQGRYYEEFEEWMMQ